MTVNKALAHTEIDSEAKFQSIWSNGLEVIAIYAYLVNHTGEPSRGRAFYGPRKSKYLNLGRNKKSLTPE